MAMHLSQTITVLATALVVGTTQAKTKAMVSMTFL